jgi:glycosyltransferase involved in cell wall biosynthesis
VRPEPDRFWFPALNDPLPEPLAGTRVVLVVGAHEPRKNVRLVLAACARALRGPREVLVIVGRLEKRDRAYARELRVRVGEIDASDAMLRALYRNAALVLVPSLAEGFGLVAIEAMACAAPVVASDTSAIPEATCGAALLLDPRDPALWAGAIRGLLDDESRASAMRARGAARFAFADRAKPAREMLTLLRELGRSGAA